MISRSFDSNILIDSLNGAPQAKRELLDADVRWISRISWIEVMSKAAPGGERVLEAFFADFGIDEITLPISRRAAELRRARSRLKLQDAIILASAQVHERVLVTRNIKDFPADMPGVHVPYTI